MATAVEFAALRELLRSDIEETVAAISAALAAAVTEIRESNALLAEKLEAQHSGLREQQTSQHGGHETHKDEVPPLRSALRRPRPRTHRRRRTGPQHWTPAKRNRTTPQHLQVTGNRITGRRPTTETPQHLQVTSDLNLATTALGYYGQLTVIFDLNLPTMAFLGGYGYFGKLMVHFRDSYGARRLQPGLTDFNLDSLQSRTSFLDKLLTKCHRSTFFVPHRSSCCVR